MRNKPDSFSSRRTFFKQTPYIFVKDLSVVLKNICSSIFKIFLQSSVKSNLIKCGIKLFDLLCLIYADHLFIICFLYLAHFGNKVQRFGTSNYFRESETLYSGPGLSLICCITLAQITKHHGELNKKFQNRL